MATITDDYLTSLAPIYRDVLSAFPKFDPTRKTGEGLAFQSLYSVVNEELRKRQIIPWIDRHDYPAGRGAIAALREEILRCRHVVYFVTSSMLRQGGWPPVERTLASLVQEQVVWKGTEFQHSTTTNLRLEDRVPCQSPCDFDSIAWHHSPDRCWRF